jgi:hypothetical protein
MNSFARRFAGQFAEYVARRLTQSPAILGVVQRGCTGTDATSTTSTGEGSGALRQRANFNRKERFMRLSQARVEQTLNQFEAHVIPESHPSMPTIRNLWGDHTYFLAVNGLNIVEPLDRRDSGIEVGTVVNLANWSDANATTLAPHEPEPTEIVVEFAPEDEAGEEPDLMH